MKLLLLHGWGGSDFPHWQSWLAAEVAKEYGCVDFLRLPEVDHPQLKRWMKAAACEIESFNPDVVVCHSLGNTLWFHLCNAGLIEKEIEHLVLVAPPSMECKIEELSSFFPATVPKNLYAKDTLMVVSDNDPYMQMQEAVTLQRSLGVRMEVLHNAGHINAKSGYGEWQWMLQYIKRLGK